MASPVKVSDRLLTLAREEARGTHRSATAQIEHWATLGRAVEVLVAYQDVLALKRAGQSLPVPAVIRRDEVHDLLMRLVQDADRETVKARIRAAGTPVYAADPEHPGRVIEVQTDGVRRAGQRGRPRLAAARFVTARRKSATRRK
jgi:hypothetical protein